jgi:lipopolysaccharide export system permease protein
MAPADTPDTAPPGLYCRLLARLAAWLAPARAAAAPPARPARPAQQPTAKPPAPSTGAAPALPTPLISPAAGIGEEQRVRAARQRAAGYEVEIQKKYAIAAACLIFALVGAPVGLRFPRGGAGLVIGTSVAVFTVYYVGLIGGEELGDRLLVSPFFAMWTPNLLFAAVGLAALWRLRRPGHSPHGGDWDELREAVGRALAALARRSGAQRGAGDRW